MNDKSISIGVVETRDTAGETMFDQALMELVRERDLRYKMNRRVTLSEEAPRSDQVIKKIFEGLGGKLKQYDDTRHCVSAFGIQSQQVVHISIRRSFLDVDAWGDSRKAILDTIQKVLESVDDWILKSKGDDEVPVNFWFARPNGEPNSIQRIISCPSWDQIGQNYLPPYRGMVEELIALKEPWNIGKIIFWHGDVGTGKCVTGDTKIITPWGYHRIDELHPARDEDSFWPLNIPIATSDGMKIASYFYAGGYKPTIHIVTENGYELEGTFEHPVLCLRPNDGLSWVKLEDLTVDDYVAIIRNQDQWGPNSVPDAYILGILVGDGHIASGKSIILSSENSDIIERFRDWAKAQGAKIHNKSGGKYDWCISSREIVRRLNQRGFPTVLSYYKEIPNIIWKANQESIRQFLRGLFDADGTADKKSGYIEISLANHQLLKDTQLLLLKFGIVGTLKPRKAGYKYNKKYRRTKAWRLTLTGNDAKLFYERVGFQLAYKQQRLCELPDKQNPNYDIVPYLRQFLPRKFGISETRIGESKLGGGRNKNGGISYPVFEKLIRQYNLTKTPAIKWIRRMKPFWSKIKTIRQSESYVYDVTMPDGHEFIANGFVSHNTTLIRSLLREWKGRVGAHYIVDPEEFFSRSSYMYSVLLEAEHHHRPRYDLDDDDDNAQPGGKLFIIEDNPDLLLMQSRAERCHEMARLLNLSDGIIGQGFNMIFLITTNEKVDKVDPAFLREGRMLQRVEFRKFPEEEAREWLHCEGVDPNKLENIGEMSLAEMYSIVRAARGGPTIHSSQDVEIGFKPRAVIGLLLHQTD